MTKNIPQKFEELVEKIGKLSVLELSELVKVLEEHFGVSAALSQVAAPAQASSEEVKEEKTSLNVELSSSGENKIAVIKVIREITGKGLKESKDICDQAPQMVKESVEKKEAEEIKKKLEEAGAKVELK